MVAKLTSRLDSSQSRRDCELRAHTTVVVRVLLRQWAAALAKSTILKMVYKSCLMMGGDIEDDRSWGLAMVGGDAESDRANDTMMSSMGTERPSAELAVTQKNRRTWPEDSLKQQQRVFGPSLPRVRGYEGPFTHVPNNPSGLLMVCDCGYDSTLGNSTSVTCREALLGITQLM